MTPLSAALLLGAGVPLLAAIVFVADARGFFAVDEFKTPARRISALLLLFAVLFVAVIMPAASLDRDVDTSKLRLGDVFVMQGVFAGFLVAWWLLSGRPALGTFTQLTTAHPFAEGGSGLLLGLLAWVMTLLVAILTALVMSVLGKASGEAVLPPLARWLAGLPVSERLLVVGSAMTVEEVFFRAFLQRRLGPVVASVLFVLAHVGYGEPLLLLGLAAVTAILAAAYAKSRSIVASVMAHGVFDAIQLLIVLPEAARMVPG